eukprot:4832850-Amphidinium_carterae.1
MEALGTWRLTPTHSPKMVVPSQLGMGPRFRELPERPRACRLRMGCLPFVSDVLQSGLGVGER